MTVAWIVIAIVAAYLIGSFPSAYIVGRIRKGFDIRQQGSRNMGAMNTFYSVGFVPGLVVLALDIGKGAAAVALARCLGTPEPVQLLAGALAVVGHNFPVFLKFHGGKGGATCIGIFAYLMPWGIPVFLAVFGLAMLISRYPTLSYSLGLLSFVFVAGFLYKQWELTVFTVALLLFVLLRYVPRIKEMRTKGGNWKNVVHRRSFGDRL